MLVLHHKVLLNSYFFLGGLTSRLGSIWSGDSPLMLKRRDALSGRAPPHFKPSLCNSCFKWFRPNASNDLELSKSSKLMGRNTVGSAGVGMAIGSVAAGATGVACSVTASFKG